VARRGKTAEAATIESGLLDRDAIVKFIAEAEGKVGKREIAKAFGIKSGDKIWLKQILRELEDQGILDRRRKTLIAPARLPPVFVADLTGRDDDGELVGAPAEWDEDAQGRPPRLLIVPPRRSKPGQPAPGVGDRVLVRVDREAAKEEGAAEVPVRVIKVLAKNAGRVLGVFRAVPGGGGRLIPVDKKSQGRELTIPPGDEAGAQDGDLVSVTIASGGRFGPPRASVKERLGSLSSEKAVSLVALYAHGIPQHFRPAALAEAEAALPAALGEREDWRQVPLITIDPADAKDHDDAVHARPDDDPGNPGGFVVSVAIADVAAYVRPHSALDRDALERGNSVYFPDRVVPMLPERISNDLCSLKPLEDRPALAVRMIFDEKGRKKGHAFHRVLMRSTAKLSYQQAQAAIEGRPDEITTPLLEPVLRPLWAAYAVLARARDQREPLALDLPERKIILRPDGHVDKVITPERLDAHRLIEEFMIQANVAAAETLEKAKSLLIYRAHDEPSIEKMRALGEVLASIGLKLPKQGALRPELFNRILSAVEESEHRSFVNEVVLRTQAQAEYTAENYGHFGLNLRRYAHFTSPIRRYADLMVHRALIRALKLGDEGLPASTALTDMSEIASRISITERRAMAAERETVDRLIAHFMADRIGASFNGQISGVTRSGLFVKLDEIGADGFIPASTIGADYYRHDEARHALVGDTTGETFRLGDRVEVRLVEAAPVAGALRFELLSDGRRGKPSQVRRGRGLHSGRPTRETGIARKVNVRRKGR
jgi:ribonuclease R